MAVAARVCHFFFLRSSISHRAILVSRFSKSGFGEDTRLGSVEYKFFVALLELFGKLAAGRNKYAIDIIARKLHYLTWEECFFCIRDDELPKALRTRYVDAMKSLFVDVGDNIDVLAEVQLCFNWEKLTKAPYKFSLSDPNMSMTGASLPFFQDLSHWILNFLGVTNSRLVASHRANNTVCFLVKIFLFFFKCFSLWNLF